MKKSKVVILAAGKGTRMHSDLPKVLHTVEGKFMIQHIIDKVRGLVIEDIILVVGYKKEMIQDKIGDSVKYAVQTEQLGTGHAVMQARQFLNDFDGNVVVLYGDMPLVNPNTIEKLIESRESEEAMGAILTIVLDNPPDFGRIVRDDMGGVLRVVEVKDCSPEELAIKEINVGMYCFDCQALLTALGELKNENAQGEYYLTDVVGIMADKGLMVKTVISETLEETLGINDLSHLSFSENLADIRYAESLYQLIDATLGMNRKK